VRIQTKDEWNLPEGRAYDVCLQLKGFGKVRRTPAQLHVIGNISHPEELTAEECDEADLVLVASERFANHLRTLTTTPVEVLLQATDHHRFRPHPPVAQYDHELAFVGKSRDVFRPAVRDALEAGLTPAIYGTAWDQFVDRSLVKAAYVPNDELPRLYSSVGVLLNDHWEWMREWGFVSNRLFDALACGATVVSDDMPELHALFGELVTTYREPDDLGVAVKRLLSSSAERAGRAERSRALVTASHTFDTRVDELLGFLEPVLRSRGPATES
jgi:spore maturation protein CgeB